jgi:hypothetical protein
LKFVCALSRLKRGFTSRRERHFFNDLRTKSSGLYGPIIVLEAGRSHDPETDRIMLMSVKGPTDNTAIMLNGETAPGPIELKQGIVYRFRFIKITPHDPLLTVSLLSGSSPVNWQAIAKDVADLPEPRPLSVKRGRSCQ